MIDTRKNKHFLKIGIYIFPLCYLFLTTFKSLFSENQMVSSSRAGLLIIWLISGYLISRKAKISQPVISALIFCSYTFILYLATPSYTNTSSFISIVSCIFVWPIAFYNAINIPFNEKVLQIAVILISITCNGMAYYWNVGKYSEASLNSVAAINSIYYILIAFLYVFLIKKTIVMLVLMAYPLITLLQSGKTTCVLLSLVLVFYYAYRNFKISSYIQKIVIVLILITSVIWGWANFDLNQIIYSASGDFDSGGSGRLDIWNNAFVIISNMSLDILFGYGYGATVAFLGIGAHNDFIEIFIDFGLIGLMLYLTFIYHMLKSIFFFNRKSNYRITYILSLITFLALSFVSKLVGTQVQFLLFTTFWGLLLSHCKLYKNGTA